jgi:hypothetical protein
VTITHKPSKYTSFLEVTLISEGSSIVHDTDLFPDVQISCLHPASLVTVYKVIACQPDFETFLGLEFHDRFHPGHENIGSVLYLSFGIPAIGDDIHRISFQIQISCSSYPT